MLDGLKEILHAYIEEAVQEAEEIIDPNSYAKGFADGIIQTSQNLLKTLKLLDKDHK